MNPNLPGLLFLIVAVVTICVSAFEILGMWRNRKQTVLAKADITSNFQIIEFRSTDLLEIIGLNKKSELEMLHNVGVSVAPGEIVALVGPEGAGQSSVLRAVIGIIPVDSGNILLNGKTLLKVGSRERIRLGLVYVSLESMCFPASTAEKSLYGVVSASPTKVQSATPDAKSKVNQLLELFQLVSVRHNTVSSLSTWDQRNLTLALAMATNPRFVLLDKPFQYVDPMAEQIMFFIEHAKKMDIGILLSESGFHATRALMISDRAYVFSEGHVIAQGRSDVLASTPDDLRAFDS